MISTLEDLAFQARELVANILNDVELAPTREEHIRLTARANEAETLAHGINQLLITELAKEQ